MEKVALVGALLLQQVSEELFGLLYNSSGLKATGFPHCSHCLNLQVNWSSGCRSHANLMKEEQKCMEELLRLNSLQTTGCFNKNAQF